MPSFASVSPVTGALFAVFGSNASGDILTSNFGVGAFAGAVPTGFTAGFGPVAILAGPIVTMIG